MTLRGVFAWLAVLCMVFAAPALAQARPMLTLTEPTFQRGDSEHTWLYKVTFTGVPENMKTTFTLYLRIPERTQVHNINESNVTSTSSRLSVFTVVKMETMQNRTVTLRVTGLARDVKAGPAVEHQWSLVNGNRINLTASAPELLYDPSAIRFVFGTGVLSGFDDYIDFAVSNDTLLVKNDSMIRTTANVGALFKVAEFRWKEVHPVDLLVSIDFSPNTDRSVDGLTFGVAIGLHKYLSIGFGYRLRMGQELSPGFRRGAEVLVEDLLESEDHKDDYERFRGLAQELQLYDGFSLTDPRTSGPFFPGNPIIESYNNTVFLGLFIPLDFRHLFAARSGS